MHPTVANAWSVAQAGGTFAEMCAGIAETMDDAADVPLRAASILNGWFADQIIADLALP